MEYIEVKFEAKKDSLVIKQDLNAAFADLKTEIIASKVDILRWLVGTLIAVGVLIIAALKIL